MASLPKPEPRFLTAEELLSMQGTPAFEEEILRQLSYLAEHDRKSGNTTRLEIDWDALPEWE